MGADQAKLNLTIAQLMCNQWLIPLIRPC
jgi:hypothetical protein